MGKCHKALSPTIHPREIIFVLVTPNDSSPLPVEYLSMQQKRLNMSLALLPYLGQATVTMSAILHLDS